MTREQFEIVAREHTLELSADVVGLLIDLDSRVRAVEPPARPAPAPEAEEYDIPESRYWTRIVPACPAPAPEAKPEMPGQSAEPIKTREEFENALLILTNGSTKFFNKEVGDPGTFMRMLQAHSARILAYVDSLRAELDAAKAKSEERRLAIANIEWLEEFEDRYPVGTSRCPDCGAKRNSINRNKGHYENCALARALED